MGHMNLKNNTPRMHDITPLGFYRFTHVARVYSQVASKSTRRQLIPLQD